MDKYTLKYHSPQLESQYLQDQLEFILVKHKHILVILLGLLLVLAIFLFYIQTFSAAIVVTIVGIIDGIQYQYFKKTKNLYCLLFISSINVFLTIERFLYAFNPDMYTQQDQNAGFIMGLSFMTLHQTLLIDPRFWVNAIVYLLITISYCISDTIQRGLFSMGLMPFIFCIVFQLYSNFQQQKLKREKYLLQKRDKNKKSIICQIVEEPCCVFVYDDDKFNFVIEDQNIGFKQIFEQDKLEIQTITQRLSCFSIPNENMNLQQFCFKQLQEEKFKMQSFDLNVLVEGKQMECQLFIENVGQPTFVIIFNNKKKLSRIIKVQQKVNHYLNVQCKSLIQQYFHKMKEINCELQQINKPNLYFLRKTEKIKNLSNKIQIEHIVQNNIHFTMKQQQSRIKLLLKIEQFNLIQFIFQNIYPLFQNKLRIINHLQYQQQIVWSNKKIIHYFFITVIQSIKLNQGNVLIDVENHGDSILIKAKFLGQHSTKLNLNLAAVKCNLKQLGPFDKIDIDKFNIMKVLIYKDIRPLNQ